MELDINETLTEEEIIFDKYVKLATIEGYQLISNRLRNKIKIKESLLMVNIMGWEKTTKKRWMHIKYSQLKKEFKWSDKTVSKIIKSLKSKNLIETKKIGMPTKQYFRIKQENVLELMGSTEFTH